MRNHRVRLDPDPDGSRDVGTEGEDPADFASLTRTFLQNQITLADSKAAVVLTASTLIMVT